MVFKKAQQIELTTHKSKFISNPCCKRYAVKPKTEAMQVIHPHTGVNTNLVYLFPLLNNSSK